MDYFVGGVAALLAGNVTPSRPKLAKQARTPTKHQLSPNVTPKSEFVDDRSVFLSPSLQKKKNVLKKSPKRIFQNPELDEANDGEGISALTSPKADKVKKHLKSELDSESIGLNYLLSPKSPKHNKSKSSNPPESPQKKKTNAEQNELSAQSSNEITPKKKKRGSSKANELMSNKENTETATVVSETTQSSKKKRKLSLNIDTTEDYTKTEYMDENSNNSDKKKKKNDSTITKLDKKTRDAMKRKLKNMKNREKKKLKKQLFKQQSTSQEKLENSLSDDNKKKTKKNKKNQQDIVLNPHSNQEPDENTEIKHDSPKKKKDKSKKKLSESKIKSAHTSDAGNESESENQVDANISIKQEKKKIKLHKKQPINEMSDSENDSKMEETTKKSKKLRKKRFNQDNLDISISNTEQELPKKLKKKIKQPAHDQNSTTDIDSNTEQNSNSKLLNKKSKVNPNAVTEQNTDSEHESDDDIGSENEHINETIFNTEQVEQNSSSDEDQAKEKGQKKQTKARASEMDDEEVIKRTLFIGNVRFSNKVKKEIKGLFSKYGQIETVRIRTVPVKDGRVTPKLAVIKNELHPERSTVNVYVKFSDPESVDKALSENNTVLNDHHLRVTRADHSGALDTSRSVFVGNLPFALEDDGLRAVFDKCGEIESVRIVRDNVTNAGKGFGYVNFASKDGVELALSLPEEDLTLKNRIIRVKRCATNTHKPRQAQGKFQGSYRDNFRPDRNQTGNFQRRNQDGNQIRTGGFHGRNQGSFQGRNQGYQGNSNNQASGFQARPSAGFRGNQEGGFQPRNKGFRGNQGRNQGFKGKGRSQGDRQRQDGPEDGAHRRIMKKRQNQESSEGPPSKVPKGAPDAGREKKPRKEFVGITADKKKKHKFNKGDKKKKVLSKILMKS